MKKYIALLLVLALCLGVFSACGAGSETADPGLDTVVAAIEGVVSTDGMAQMDADYIKNMFNLTTEDYEQCLVMSTNVGTSIDEFGIFKGADETQAAALKTAVEEYLQFRLDSWMPEYLPEEFPKLQGAQLWAEGDYVMYAILSDDAKAAAGEAFTGCFAG